MKDMKDKILLVKNLEFAYGQSQILHNINFAVAAGSICGLLGPNGSGKTTLLKCINGLLKPKYGQVLVDGQGVELLSREQIAGLMGVVPQQSNVVFAFTVLDIVVMAKAAALGKIGSPSRRDYKEARQVLGEVGIVHLAERRFNELSGGERQMVLLARALLQDPSILLLDEPTAHLDFKNQFVILELVKDLTRQKNLTTIITIHDPNLAGRYCEQIVMLKGGEILKNGLRHEVFQAETLGEVYDMGVIVDSTVNGSEVVLPVELEI